jgi:hypothetical protein
MATLAMNSTTLSKKEKKRIVRSDIPVLSTILAIGPKMSAETELEYQLKWAAGEVENELMSNHSSGLAISGINNLQPETEDTMSDFANDRQILRKVYRELFYNQRIKLKVPDRAVVCESNMKF